MVLEDFIGVDDFSVVETGKDDETVLAICVAQLLDLTGEEVVFQLFSET